MDLQAFVAQCESSASQAAEIRQSLEQKTTELAEIFQQILENKALDKDSSSTLKNLTEAREFQEKLEVERIRTKQQLAKATARQENMEHVLQKVVTSAQKGVSEKDEQKMYDIQLKNYLLRRITGVNFDMDETKNGNVSGWISNLRTSTFEPFGWKKDEKTEQEGGQHLWERMEKIDPNRGWDQPGLFGDSDDDEEKMQS